MIACVQEKELALNGDGVKEHLTIIVLITKLIIKLKQPIIQRKQIKRTILL